MGFELPAQFSFGFVDSFTEGEEGEFHERSTFTLGLTTTTYRGDRIVAFRVQLLRGMPAIGFERVLAHELGHVAAALARYELRTHEQSEGFAEFVAMQYLLRYSKHPDAWGMAMRMRNVENSYGLGLREVIDAVSERGLSAYLNSLAIADSSD